MTDDVVFEERSGAGLLTPGACATDLQAGLAVLLGGLPSSGYMY